MNEFILREEGGTRFASLNDAFLAAVPILAEMIVLKREMEASENEDDESRGNGEQAVPDLASGVAIGVAGQSARSTAAGMRGEE